MKNELKKRWWWEKRNSIFLLSSKRKREREITKEQHAPYKNGPVSEVYIVKVPSTHCPERHAPFLTIRRSWVSAYLMESSFKHPLYNKKIQKMCFANQTKYSQSRQSAKASIYFCSIYLLRNHFCVQKKEREREREHREISDSIIFYTHGFDL